jgi:hypothetical protein
VRIQRIIDERYESYYAFSQALAARGRQALSSTIRGWLPPQNRWRQKPNGQAVRKIDWEAVRIPDGASLMEFCELLSVRADYILFGEGSPSRGQSRDRSSLQQDLAVFVAESLKAEGISRWTSADIDASGILSDVVASTRQEASEWMAMIGHTPARVLAQSGALVDEIEEVGRFLANVPEALASYLVLVQMGLTFEASVESASAFPEGLNTRYLAVPKLSEQEMVLNPKLIEDRMKQRAERQLHQDLESPILDPAMRRQLADVLQTLEKRRRKPAR